MSEKLKSKLLVFEMNPVFCKKRNQHINPANREMKCAQINQYRIIVQFSIK